MNIEELESLLKQAYTDEESGRFESAKLLANQVVDTIAIDTKNQTALLKIQDNRLHDILISAKLIIGICLWRNSATSEALEVYNDLEKYELSDFYTAKVLYCKANIYIEKGKFDEAISMLNKSLRFFKHIGSKKEQWKVLSALTLVYTRTGKLLESKAIIEETLIEIQQAHDEREECAFLHNLGGVQYKLGENTQALVSLTKAYNISKRLEAKSLHAAITKNIGIIYRLLGDYEQSLRYYSEALQELESLGMFGHMAALLGNIGNLYASMGNSHRALDYMKRSIQLHEKLGMMSDVAIVMGNIGNIQRELGNYENALESFQKGLELNQELGMIYDAAKVIGNIGTVYTQMGNYRVAMDYYSKARTLFNELSMSNDNAWVILNIANLYADPHNPDCDIVKAEIMYNEVCTLYKNLSFHQQLLDCYSIMGNFYTHNKNFEKALEYRELYYTLKDSMQTEKLKQSAEYLDLRQQKMEKEQQRVLAEKEAEIAQLHYEKQKQENELLKQDLMHKERELTAMIERLVQKSQFITTISKKLEEIAELNRNESKREIYHLIEILESRSIDESERSVMFLQLQSVYGDFMKILGERYSSLQEKEIITCALLKMKLPSSKIALMLGVSDRSVEKYRGNIRKKIGLPAGASIENFLEKFYDKE